MNNVIQIHSKAEGEAWATQFCEGLVRPTVVLLDGEMGAGKTQMVRWCLSQLGVRDVASPTFAIHHEYPSPSGAIDHIDLYRVKSDADLEASGFWDLFNNKSGLVFIEWASRLPNDVYPGDWTILELHIGKLSGDEERRVLTLKKL